MQIYKAPVDDMVFQLKAFGYDEVVALERYAAYDVDTAEALLRQAGAFATAEMLPLNRLGDEQGLKWDPKTGAVTTPEGFKAVYQKMVDNGFVGIHGDADFGGSAAPMIVWAYMSEMWTAANKSLSMCPGLTQGLVEAIEAHGSQELKETYLPKTISGEWTGTMCLTEPQCGTDLGLVRTKAVPEGDHYRLTGTKIWITFGEHDLTDNIVHLVLARLPDAPAGIRGISTFVVPKICPDGTANTVKCTGLEHKMGIKASPTCVIDMEEAHGWLVGEPHRGMKAMFTMMNGARLLVGMEGVALSDIAYQTALEFAKDRRQSRSLDPAKREKDEPADNIMVHPDVRRMLLNVKSTTEGMRGLGTWVGIQNDISHHHGDEATRTHANDLVALLTPVIKGYFTERGFFNVSEAMQVCGGAGFTTDWSIEQFLRDTRIGMIYEGTNHIQALDLVGRKLPSHGGRLLQAFGKEVTAAVEAAKAEEKLADMGAALEKSFQQLMGITMEMGGKAMADPEVAAAAASNYLNLFGLTALAFSWTRQALAAVKDPGSHTETKLKLANYFFSMILPESKTLAALVKVGKEPIMAFDVDEF